MLPTTQPVLSVVVPLYNEGAHLKEVFQSITQVLQSLEQSFELIFVDDGSQDDTWAGLSALRKDHPWLDILRLSRNFGKEAALAAGLQVARGQAVVILDGDLQHPPELIREMFARWQEGEVDIVEAVKVARSAEPLFVRMGARLFYGMHARLGGTALQGATDFKLLDRKVIDAWKQMGERNIFFRGMAAWLGFRRETVSFSVPPRVGGASRWSLWGLLRLAVTGITSFTSLPLHLTTLIGGLFLLFSFLLGGHTLYMKFTGQAVSGFATVILLLLIMGSCILISIGIVGIYIARIYEEVKARPRYLVAERQEATDGEMDE